jgi:D-alanyl-D-alanine carboxypeptidase
LIVDLLVEERGCGLTPLAGVRELAFDRPDVGSAPLRTDGETGDDVRLASRIAVAVCAVGVLTACSTPSHGVPATPAHTSAPAANETAYTASVQEKVTAAMKANVIPGAVVRISSPTQGDWTGTFGTATIGQNDPLTVQDHFRAGSITKTMTSTVILQLVQEGKLSLQDPIGKFRTGVPNGDRITIAELAEMRSGLYSYTFDRGFNQTSTPIPARRGRPRSCWPSRSPTR